MSGDLHLFRFGYTWPEELAWVDAHPDADVGEASDAVFIRADSREAAEALGEEVAEAYVKRLYGERAYSWREVGFASWIEDDREVLEWAAKAQLPVVESVADIEATVIEMINRE